MNNDRRKAKGSLTIEASLVIPLFMFAVFMVLSVINLMRFHLNLQEAVHREALRLSLLAYEEWDVSEGSVKTAVIDAMDDSVKGRAPVEGGADAIDLSLSRLDDREIVEINASYEAKLPYDFTGLFNKRFTARSLVHTYIGYEKGLADISDRINDEEYVYVTETGTVYHKDAGCSYLKLSIRKVSKESVMDLRNSGGHKYYPCEICGRLAGSTVYITNDGTCYHGSLDCSGLKRTIHCIPISKVGGRGPCSRCSR